MERYKEYRDSGIQWVGELPSHWDFLAGKKIYLRNDGGVWGIDPLDDGKDTIVLRSTEQTVDGKLVINNPAKRYLSETEKQGNLLEENDLIITKSSGSPSHIGKTSIINKEVAQLKCCYSNFIQRIRIKGCPMYYWYVFNSILIKTQFDILTTTTTGLKNISAKIIDRVLLPLPPLHEQEKIVSFLESKNSKIDEYIAEKEKEVQLLNELKEAEIAKIVTQGLNPNVKMEDSGISWIGMIPEHWGITKIGSLFSERREKVSDKDYPALSVSKQGITPQLETAVKTDNGDNRKKVCIGDFVVNSRSDRKGSCGVSPYTGSVSLINIVLQPRTNIEGQYYHYLFRSNNYIEEYYRLGRGIVADLWTTRFSEMRNIMIPIPPLDEQRAIVAYISEKTAKVESLITDLQAEIEFLKEYKQRLNADCVTGQVNVQNE